ncbi:MAG: hypothetical protein OXC62_00715 [Aestuariivita sp.]|nr:hypothetical protein [Aestuariivita sp.]
MKKNTKTKSSATTKKKTKLVRGATNVELKSKLSTSTKQEKNSTEETLPTQLSLQELQAKARQAEKKSKKISLLELTERTCKWPVGDPATDDFWFCGLPSLPGKPYCKVHVTVAFQPLSIRRERRRQ